MNQVRNRRSHRSGRGYGAVLLGFAASLAIAACGSSGSTGSTGAAGNSAGSGGQGSSNAAQTLKVGGWDYNTLDPGATVGFLGPELPMAEPIYGLLFDPPSAQGGAFVPDLAASYSYAKDFKSVTITPSEPPPVLPQPSELVQAALDSVLAKPRGVPIPVGWLLLDVT